VEGISEAGFGTRRNGSFKTRTNREELARRPRASEEAGFWGGRRVHSLLTALDTSHFIHRNMPPQKPNAI